MAGLKRSCVLAERHFHDDPHKRATLLRCAIIANHPFNDGSHRTSLEAATIQLMMDGWLYEASEEDEKQIYNWRFDYEEAHDMEAQWTRVFGGWDMEGEDRALLELVASPYGEKIERFLREHTEEMPVETLLLMLPPEHYVAMVRAYPGGAWKKALNRVRRANASRWQKELWPTMRAVLAQGPQRRTPRPHWRPEKL